MEENSKITIKDLTTEEALQTLIGKGKGKKYKKDRKQATPSDETSPVVQSPPPPPPPPPKKIDIAPSAKDLVDSFHPRPLEDQARNHHQSCMETPPSVSWSSIVLLVAGGFLVGWGVCRVARAIFSTGAPQTLTADEILGKLTPEQVAELINA
jgi:hypothetical protein